MKKTIICSISMKENNDQVVYSSKDKSLPVSERKVRYPICAFLEKTMESDDELEVIILVKKIKKITTREIQNFLKKNQKQ